MDSNNRRIVSLTAILVALIILYIVGTLFSPENIQEREAGRLLFEGVVTADITGIELKNNDTSISLERNEEGNWNIRIEGHLFPAENDTVNTLIDAVAGLQQNRIAGTTTASWQQFDLEQESRGLFFLDAEGRQRIGIIVGERGTTGSGDFIRIRGDERVYQTEISLSFYLEKDTSYWSDLTLYPGESLEDAEIALVSINADIRLGDTAEDQVSANYTLFKSVEENREIWRVQNRDAELDQGKVESLIRALTTLEGERFVPVPEGSTVGFSDSDGNPVQAEIQIQTSGGKTFLLRIGTAAGPDEYYLESSASPYVYTLSAWSAGRIVKNSEEFFIEE